MFGNPIEPALSDEAWASVAAGNGLPYALGSSILDELVMLDGADIPAGIAYLNSRLPDSDPRKITREMVARIRTSAEHTRLVMMSWKTVNAVQAANEDAARLLRYADALESYLRREVA